MDGGICERQIVSAARDHPSVTGHAEYILRQFVAARSAGDDAAARLWWDRLVTENFDVVTNMVKATSHSHLSPAEQDDALQRALIKLINNMIHTFNGSTMGEWVNATKTLVYHACVDVQRRATAISEKSAPLHTTGDDGEETERLHPGVQKAIGRRHAETEADDREAKSLAAGSAFLDWALPKLTEKRRKVIEFDRQGVPSEEIERRLGMSRDAVYQSRHRGMQDLERLREEYPS